MKNFWRPKIPKTTAFNNPGKLLMTGKRYARVATVATEAITEAIARYIHEAMLEKEEQQEGNEPA